MNTKSTILAHVRRDYIGETALAKLGDHVRDHVPVYVNGAVKQARVGRDVVAFGFMMIT